MEMDGKDVLRDGGDGRELLLVALNDHSIYSEYFIQIFEAELNHADCIYQTCWITAQLRPPVSTITMQFGGGGKATVLPPEDFQRVINVPGQDPRTLYEVLFSDVHPCIVRLGKAGDNSPKQIFGKLTSLWEGWFGNDCTRHFIKLHSDPPTSPNNEFCSWIHLMRGFASYILIGRILKAQRIWRAVPPVVGEDLSTAVNHVIHRSFNIFDLGTWGVLEPVQPWMLTEGASQVHPGLNLAVLGSNPQWQEVQQNRFRTFVPTIASALSQVILPDLVSIVLDHLRPPKYQPTRQIPAESAIPAESLNDLINRLE